MAAKSPGRAHAVVATTCLTFSANRTLRGLVDMESCRGVVSIAGLPFRRIFLGSVEAAGGDEDNDRPADDEVFFCRPSTDRSNCQSIPCCFLSLAKDSRRASMSSFDLAILSGWWYSTVVC